MKAQSLVFVIPYKHHDNTQELCAPAPSMNSTSTRRVVVEERRWIYPPLRNPLRRADNKEQTFTEKAKSRQQAADMYSRQQKVNSRQQIVDVIKKGNGGCSP
jgi:hypothetical protein